MSTFPSKEEQPTKNEQSLQQHQQEADKHEQEADKHEQEADKHEQEADKHEQKADKHEQEADKHEQKADKYEQKADKYGQKLDKHKQELEGKVFFLEKSIKDLQVRLSEVVMMPIFSSKGTQSLRHHQQEIEKQEQELEGKIFFLEKSIKDLQVRLSEDEEKIFPKENKITQSELNIKNGFTQQQRETFKDSIENELNTRKQELDKFKEKLEQLQKTLYQKESDLVSRERSVKEREIVADTGFAEKNKIAFREIERRAEECIEYEKKLKKREDEFLAKYQSLEQHAEELRKREESLRIAEAERDKGFTKQRKSLDDELAQKQMVFDKEILGQRIQRFQELDHQIAHEQKERLDSLQNELNQEIHRTKQEIAKLKDDFQQEKNQIEQSLKEEKQQLKEFRVQLETKEYELQFKKKDLESKEDKLDQMVANIENEIEQRTAERRKSFEEKEKQIEEECIRLRESLTRTDQTIGLYDELKRRLGGKEPEEVLKKMNLQEEELKKLREELLERPTAEMLSTFDRINNENDRLKSKSDELQQKISELQKTLVGENELRRENSALQAENNALTNRKESLQLEYNFIQSELKRIRASYERTEDRADRIRDIEIPYFETQPVACKEIPTETEWLTRIEKSCVQYGLRFPKRILYAFHTALKTAEWSLLTVLAGVSGTGKSELPRLYSHFGGFNFLPLVVQPNWDSQESMLGFFNSIDNKFDAQPVLRLLAQSQKETTKDYPGLQDFMSLILLDEMNLAHVELYFADFLSKLELRRGCKGKDVPVLDVKLGAGTEHYHLPLGRNVLWAGTMNQDETTKSLSDKVLDRGIIIHFPRPTKFERRRKLQALGKSEPLLPRKTWESWWVRESQFTEEQIQPFKSFIEDMNQSLAKAGRSLGHRVWQSLEYYMANYPEVRLAQAGKDDNLLQKAMKVAFEDQLVQKVMPKLQGIDTRGRSKTECLDKIRAQFVQGNYSIVEDFDLACEFGYGQFMWHSANYLKNETNEICNEEKNSKKQIEEPPIEINSNIENNQNAETNDSSPSKKRAKT